jgi:DNA-binding transcriptional LysR family regulator
MELRQLRSLIAVVDYGGFRAAASAEHVAQPAITRHLQTLERELGVTLFERSGRGVKPTPTARHLYDTVKPHVTALDEAVAAIRTGSTTTVRIGYIAPAIISLVPRLVDVARSHSPGIQIELHTLTNPELLDQVSTGAIDLGFALSTDPPVRGVVATPIEDMHYLLAASVNDPLAASNPVPLSALTDRSIVTPATREPTHQQMVEYVRAHADGVTVQDAFTLDAVLSLVGAGVGLAFVPEELITTPPPGIAFVDTEPPLPTATLTLVRPAHHSRVLRPIIDAFLATVAPRA